MIMAAKEFVYTLSDGETKLRLNEFQGKRRLHSLVDKGFGSFGFKLTYSTMVI